LVFGSGAAEELRVSDLAAGKGNLPVTVGGGGRGWARGHGRASRLRGVPPSRPSPASGGRGRSVAALAPSPACGEGRGGGGRRGSRKGPIPQSCDSTGSHPTSRASIRGHRPDSGSWSSTTGGSEARSSQRSSPSPSRYTQ